MKAQLVVAGIGLGLALGVGCKVSEDSSPLLLGNFHRFDEDCTVVTDLVAGRGSLDVSSRANYVISVEVISQVSNKITLNTIEFDYTSPELGATIASQTQPFRF